ncbi:MAG: type II secretion system protein GspM [Sphingorhabdus sp.]
MTDKIRIWFTALSLREQWMIGSAAVLAGLLVLIYGLIFPLWWAIDNSIEAHDKAVERRGRIEASVAAARGNNTNPVQSPTDGSPLDLVVVQSATEKGFDIIKSPNSASGQFVFRMEQARAPALLAWLDELDGQGIEVRSLTLRPAGNGSLAVDAVVTRASN